MQGCRDGEERDRCHAEKVSENEHSHALGNLGVSTPGGVLWVVNTEIYAYVTVTNHQESNNIENEHSHHINLSAECVDIHGQTDAHFAVTTDPHKREQGNQQRESPASYHYGCDMMHAQPLVDMHGIGNGMPSFKTNHSQRVYRQLAGKHSQKPCYATSRTGLPVCGVIVVLMTGMVVHEGNQDEIKPHAQVGEGQITHEKSGDCELMVANQQDDQNSQVTGHSENRNDPGETAQEGKAQQVLARIKSIWLWGAFDKRVAKTVKFQVLILKVDAIDKTRVISSRISEEYTLKLASKSQNNRQQRQYVWYSWDQKFTYTHRGCEYHGDSRVE